VRAEEETQMPGGAAGTEQAGAPAKKDTGVRAYATALFEIARAEDVVVRVNEDLEKVVSTLAGHMKLKEILGDAGFPAAKKHEILREIFAGALSPVTLNGLIMLVDAGRDGEIAEVAAAYTEIAESGTGQIIAKVTTAVPLTDELRAELSAKLAGMAGRDVAIQEKVDPSVLGGVVVEMGGRVLDGSVRTRLAEMKERLVQPAPGAPKEGEK